MKPDQESTVTPVRALTRREMLAFMSAAAATTLAGCGRVPSELHAQTVLPACLATPAQTEGPYFVDEKLNRSDIRRDPSDNSVRPGVPLRLGLTVYNVAAGACDPIPGAIVDVWHCDALGAYSDVNDPGEGGDTRGRKFLRGYQVTNAHGKVEFLTVYPGWYGGRSVHIHFKIRSSLAAGGGREFTSQLYFDEATTDRVHAQAPYARKGRRDTTNNGDGLYRRGGANLLLQLTQDARGYAGAYTIGLVSTRLT